MHKCGIINVTLLKPLIPVKDNVTDKINIASIAKRMYGRLDNINVKLTILGVYENKNIARNKKKIGTNKGKSGIY